MFDRFPVKVNVLIRYFHETKAYHVSLYDQGWLAASDDSKPVVKVEEAFPLALEICEGVQESLAGGQSLSFGVDAGPCRSLAIEFWRPAGRRKNGRLTYRVIMGGRFSLDEDHMILPFPGQDTIGSKILLPDHVSRPLVLAVLEMAIKFMNHQKTMVLLSAGDEGEGIAAGDMLPGLDTAEGSSC